jgi:hypothetical protein
LWSLEWWIVMSLAPILISIALWWLCSRSLLLQQIFWPPIVEGGHHTSKRWSKVKSDRLRNSNGRCAICGCRGDRTWHLFSIERKGWRFRIIAARATSRKPPVHELLYAWLRSNGPVPKRWLWILCTTHHNALHRFDKWLLPWDRRNRWLWLTSLLYLGGWYVAYLTGLTGIVGTALYFMHPDLLDQVVNVVASVIR